MKLISSLRSKVAMTMWMLAAASTIVATFMTGRLLIQSHLESVRQQIQATATSLTILGITDFSELEDFNQLNSFVESTLQMDRTDKIIRVFDRHKRLLFTTAGPDFDKLPGLPEKDIKKPSFVTMQGEAKDYESVVLPYEGRGQRTFYLQVAMPLPEYSRILNNLWLRSLIVLTVLLGVTILIARQLSTKLLKPVESVAEHLRVTDPAKIEEWQPLKIDESGEYLRSIADGINLLRERTKSAILGLRAMSRYVAHELRTPLTILRGEAEMALLKKDAGKEYYAAVLKSSLEEVHRMEDIINTVLQIGDVAQAKKMSRPERCELISWVEKNALLWQKNLGRQINVKVEKGADAEVYVDTKLLFRLIDNLVRNIRKHTPADTKCSIVISSRDGKARLNVYDNGPGLTARQVESLNRLGGMSDVAGVGLNLCCKIAEICGINITFSPSTDRGLSVILDFSGDATKSRG